MKRFKFGDRVTNPNAGEGNPRKNGTVVRTFTRSGRINPGVTLELTDEKGDFWEIKPEFVEMVTASMDNKVERYNFDLTWAGGHYEVKEESDPDGDWVKFTAYDAQAERLRKAEELLRNMRWD